MFEKENLNPDEIEKIEHLAEQITNTNNEEEVKRFINEMTLIKERAWVRKFEKENKGKS